MTDYDSMESVCVGGDFVASLVKICRDAASHEKRWIAAMRSAGLKAAHPDDGWVDRERNEVGFCYPSFYDNPRVGDEIALAYHFDRNPRFVRIVAVVHKPIQRIHYFRFEAVSTTRTVALREAHRSVGECR